MRNGPITELSVNLYKTLWRPQQWNLGYRFDGGSMMWLETWTEREIGLDIRDVSVIIGACMDAIDRRSNGSVFKAQGSLNSRPSSPIGGDVPLPF